MKLSKILDLRGTKIAYLVLAMVGNVAMALLFFSLVDGLMARYGELVTGLDTTPPCAKGTTRPAEKAPPCAKGMKALIAVFRPFARTPPTASCAGLIAIE